MKRQLTVVEARRRWHAKHIPRSNCNYNTKTTFLCFCMV